MTFSPVNLDDVTGCPMAEGCECCGTPAGLSVVILDTPIGIYCVTLCSPCTAADRPGPAFGWTDTALRVCEHSHHLGIDLDQMAGVLDADKDSACPDVRALPLFMDFEFGSAR